MKLHALVPAAGTAAAGGLALVLGLSFMFPALANPAALVMGATAGIALAYRERLPFESRSFRLGLVLLAIASGAVVWGNLQPRYIGI